MRADDDEHHPDLTADEGPAAPTTARRAHRKVAAADEIGCLELARGGGALPAFSLDQWFLMRRLPGHLRGGFRAWIRDRDAPHTRKRALGAWDLLHAAYQVAEVK